MDFSTPLASVVTAVKALPGVETASSDPADIIAPGVLVSLSDLEPETLAGWRMNLNLTLIVADTDGGPGPAAALSALLSTVLTYAQPDGPVVARTVYLPNNQAPFPALVFPLQTRIDAP